jgi:hypothetical protein
MDAGLYVCRRSGLKVGITLGSTFVMSVLYFLLIPHYGSMGAALATLGGFAFLALLTLVVSQRVFPVQYEWSRLLLLLLLGIGTWLIGHTVPAAWSWSPLKMSLLLGVLLLAWKIGLVSPTEKAYLAGLAVTLRDALHGRLLAFYGRRVTTKDGAMGRSPSGVTSPVHFSG